MVDSVLEVQNIKTTGISPQKDIVTTSGAGDVTVNGNIVVPDSGTIGSESDTDAITIDSSGNLLLNTTTPSNSARFDVRPISTSRIINTRSYSAATQYHHTFENNSGALVGYISVTSSATAYGTSSDYRLKTDVQPMSGATERLKALNPINFAWKADGSRADGFLAHEAQEVVPEAVIGEKDAVDADGNPEYQGIDQAKLVPLLTAALQEAVSKIEALTARIEALENAAG